MSTMNEAVESVLASREVAERIATAREEQREACAARVRSGHENNAEWFTQKVLTTPLTATPLADTIRDLRADLATAASVAAELRKERDSAESEREHVIEGLAQSATKRLAAEAERDDLRARNEELVAALERVAPDCPCDLSDIISKNRGTR